MKTVEYLDAVKRASGLASDYQLAHVLGVTRSAVSLYRNKKSVFDNTVALKIAELLNVDPMTVIADCELERGSTFEGWKRWAAGFVLTLGAATLGATIAPGSTEARTLHNQNLGPEYTYGPKRRRFLGVRF